MQLWLASLDLSKAFDRLEWGQLFYALELQGVPQNYRHLLAALYSDQKGTIPKLGEFPILRGVKQGDVLNPVLFNAGLQLAMERWKPSACTNNKLSTSSKANINTSCGKVLPRLNTVA